ncbi:ABC1 kinase family protein [Polymorphobacter fuscus]|uniref:AarF/ABC1/UbiB kinase family protein n=1 Tax=Sandarakinorhabdus fusca TaxID=1439888 RepID=A0A7C9KMA1_9SPHN|nr:AarF/ABC1/UbiB kinase family protein [Polymorphobacter fuscus]KAB7646442.1 AarF/ABC1/UbiB kinase family protein [Polymorphobacter fuscus]MQT17683.1 AarF/ABC1/UbiB kinase family protein [Polymorphobacter fuscus]NJC09772.1 putative unusual protein kinase regulating ubiquinone biosynthesis (AarF/ABC1/UbiB family) [Polymorphobacter fuscus]
MALPRRPTAAVPHGRLARLARFGGMAGGIAGGMIAEGARQWATGQKPTVAGLLLTPANALRVTQQLANLRGAAMKMGQLLSMDSGDFLPPELAEIMGALRADATPMPPAQLQAVLAKSWGKDWRRQFERFDVRPIAAASIGQVHRARTRDGRDLAIKVQYPGVRDSIDSDVDNVATLIRMSGLVPATLDVAPMLAEAKRQLHEEADYAREGECLAEFGRLLADAPDYRVPRFHADLSGRDVLAMDFVAGVAIETLVDAPQAERDRVMTLMIALCLREMFEFRLMQTDPNFANYRHDPATGRLVLLDFGATRAFSAAMIGDYAALLRAGMDGDAAGARDAMLAIGLFDTAVPAKHQAAIATMFDTAFAPLRADGLFDFTDNRIAASVRDEGIGIAADRDFWHIPPIDALFLQRKFAGLFLLGSRLGAKVDMAALLAPYRPA